MKHLLDVNMLLAADAWLVGKNVVICPVSELGFLRISTNKKAYGATMEEARLLLEKFIADTKATRIPADLSALDSNPSTSDQVTDHYLADLAANHGLKFATLDAGIKHAAVVLVS